MRASNVTIEPTLEPIRLEEAKAQVRVTWPDEDEYIARLIKAATAKVEAYTRRSLLNRTIETRFDGFSDSLWLPSPPLVSVSAVKYIDGDGAEQTVTSSIYAVDTFTKPGRVRLAYGQAWPTARAEPHSVRVTHVSGYGTAEENVPEDIRHALILLIAHYYDIREPVVTGHIASKIPLSYASLLEPHIVFLEFVT